MPWLATIVLVIWLPTVFFLFEKYSVVKAIVFAFVTGWLFLPPTQIPLPGFPDWSKMTATVISVLMCVCIKQPQRIFSLRPRWYDVPVAAYCVIPFIASVSNGLGAYDGLSAVLDELVRWGLPYLIGRAYLATPSGSRQLCLGIAVGGMLYVPLCLLEIRMSPQLKNWIYGFVGAVVDFGLRYGGYRPIVFLSTGLELGWWMCCASFAAYLLWRSGAVKRVDNYPMSTLTIILCLTAVACKSTGALLQIFVGFGLVFGSRFLKSSILVWVLMAIGPAYCIARPLGYFTGERVISLAESLFGPERAQSLGYRFEQEEILIRSAIQRPAFGWARSGGFNPPDASGKAAITDGLWIIVFGWMGFAGLAALNGMLLIPTGLFLWRYPPRTWFEPDIAPLVTLAIILPLFMVDNLSNAMLNPIYALAMGSVAGCLPRRDRGHDPIDQEDRRILEDLPGEPALPGSPQRTRGGSARDIAADQFEDEAMHAASVGDVESARSSFERALARRQAALSTHATASRFDRLARTHVAQARFLTRIGATDEAIHSREKALEVWTRYQSVAELAGSSLAEYAANLNDLAWRLVARQSRETGDIDRAIILAEEALSLVPDDASFWNTLGIVRYRRGDHLMAIHALSRAVSCSPDQGNAFDFYYLALANHALGYPRPTAAWIERAEEWSMRHPEVAILLESIQREAQQAIQPHEIL